MIRRRWELKVMNKQEYPAGDLRHIVALQPADWEHPVLWDKTPMGSPLTVPCTREEFDGIELGDIMEFVLRQVP